MDVEISFNEAVHQVQPADLQPVGVLLVSANGPMADRGSSTGPVCAEQVYHWRKGHMPPIAHYLAVMRPAEDSDFPSVCHSARRIMP